MAVKNRFLPLSCAFSSKTMKAAIILNAFVLCYTCQQIGAAEATPVSEQELALQASSMSQFVDAIRTRPEVVLSWRLGTVKSIHIRNKVLHEGQAAMQPITTIEFNGRNFNGSELVDVCLNWEMKHRVYVLGQFGGERPPNGYFLDSCSWYEQAGDVILNGGPPNLPKQGTEVFKIPANWGGHVMAVLRKRKEKAEWFEGVHDKKQRQQIDEDIEKGVPLWSLVLARHVVTQDPSAWSRVIKLLFAHQDSVLLAAFIFPKMEIPIERLRPWNVLWDGVQNLHLLNASAIACAAAASGENAMRCMAASVFIRLDNRRPAKDELMKEPFLSCPPYQWAQELASEILLLKPELREELMQSSTCLILLDKMKIISAATTSQVR